MGFTRIAFRTRLDARYFYRGPVQDEALARLDFLVEERRRVALLMGEMGIGKSLLLYIFAAAMRRAGWPVVTVNLLGLDQSSLIWQLASGLGLSPEPHDPPARLWQALGDRIAEFRYQELSVVLLLDDADRAKSDALTLVTRLAQQDLSPESRLTLVLTGRQEQMGRLGRTLLEMAELRIDLEPWEAQDTDAFLCHSLSQAGRKQSVFDPSATARIHELSGGVPRRIAHLADMALVAGAAENLNQITAETIDAVYDELGVIRV